MKAADHPPEPNPAYETTDASPRVIAMTAAALVVGIALSIAAATIFYLSRYRSQFRADEHVLRQTSFTDGPNQRTSLESDWAQSRAETASHLNNYAWIDRSKGLVRIPVRRAMELLAVEGNDSAKPSAATAPNPPPAASPAIPATSPARVLEAKKP